MFKLVNDHLGRGINPGNYVFFHGNLYQVKVTTRGEPEAKDPGHYVHLQYAAKGWFLKKPKRVYSESVCLVDTAEAEAYIAKQKAKWEEALQKTVDAGTS